MPIWLLLLFYFFFLKKFQLLFYLKHEINLKWALLIGPVPNMLVINDMINSVDLFIYFFHNRVIIAYK